MIHRYKLHFKDTKELCDFVRIANKIDSKINFIDPIKGYRTNGKSLLGALATIEWVSLYCECDEDIFAQIEPFIQVDGDKKNLL